MLFIIEVERLDCVSVSFVFSLISFNVRFMACAHHVCVNDEDVSFSEQG